MTTWPKCEQPRLECISDHTTLSKLNLSTNVLDIFLFSVNDAYHCFPNSFTKLTKSILTFTICLTLPSLLPLKCTLLNYFSILDSNFKHVIPFVRTVLPFPLSISSILWCCGTPEEEVLHLSGQFRDVGLIWCCLTIHFIKHQKAI